jgi:hypothetical protein
MLEVVVTWFKAVKAQVILLAVLVAGGTTSGCAPGLWLA